MREEYNKTFSPWPSTRMEADGSRKIPMPLRSAISHGCDRMGSSRQLGKKTARQPNERAYFVVFRSALGPRVFSLFGLPSFEGSAHSRFGHNCAPISFGRTVLA